MLYIVEAIFVGIYCGFIYSILSQFIDEFMILLFVVGFLKHFLGYHLSLHSMFCKYGEACERSHHETTDSTARMVHTEMLAYESFLEGFAFFIFGYFMTMVCKDRLLVVVTIGFLLHIIAEKLGIHKSFCKIRCIKNDKVPLFEPGMFHETL